MPGPRALCIQVALLWQGQDLCWGMTWQYGRLFPGFLNTHPLLSREGRFLRKGIDLGRGDSMFFYAMPCYTTQCCRKKVPSHLLRQVM